MFRRYDQWTYDVVITVFDGADGKHDGQRNGCGVPDN